MEETDGAGANPITGVTIDDLMMKNGLVDLDVVKMDIEGSEREVFRSGAESWLGWMQ